MTTSQPTPFLSEILNSPRVPEEGLAYFRSRLKSRLHSFVLAQFQRAEQEGGFSRADLARKLGKEPAQITRWLAAPGNWEVDTLSDLLLGMGLEPRLSAANLHNGPIQPASEDWRNTGDRLGSRPADPNKDNASNESWFGGQAKPPEERRFG